tara:strand:- start:13448 stop:13978 length:531 start_codon:yes stop_codon:yes gene_type:complete
MAWIAPVMAMAGSLFQAKGQMDAGEAALVSAEFRAVQDEQAANNVRGSAQRAAIEERRQGALASSRATALAAASGGGADDVTVTDVVSSIAGESEYRALARLYQGEDQALSHLSDASLSRTTGADAKRAGDMAAAGTLLQAGGDLAGRYGGGGSAPKSGGGAGSYSEAGISSGSYA